MSEAQAYEGSSPPNMSPNSEPYYLTSADNGGGVRYNGNRLVFSFLQQNPPIIGLKFF